ncbi:MAG: C39 family peptidase [Candidatus Magasanikbacteria bacterium]
MKGEYRTINIVGIVASIFCILGILFVFREMKQMSTISEQEFAFTYLTRSDFTEAEKPIEGIPQTEEKNIVENAKELNLLVPFTSQAPEYNWEQPWQDACEEAALLMLDAYYKEYTLSPFFARDEMLKMIGWETEKNWGYSIPMEKILELTKEFVTKNTKYTPRVIENPTIEIIKEQINKGNPVYVVADGKKLQNPNFTNGGPVYHALIIRGYNETSFITNDPGTRKGENFMYSYKNIMESIHDWNDGNVPNGKAVILVLE